MLFKLALLKGNYGINVGENRNDNACSEVLDNIETSNAKIVWKNLEMKSSYIT